MNIDLKKLIEDIVFLIILTILTWFTLVTKWGF